MICSYLDPRPPFTSGERLDTAEARAMMISEWQDQVT